MPKPPPKSPRPNAAQARAMIAAIRGDFRKLEKAIRELTASADQWEEAERRYGPTQPKLERNAASFPRARESAKEHSHEIPQKASRD